MGTGLERPVEPSNTELMVSLEDLQERMELLQELTETLIKHLGGTIVPEWRRLLQVHPVQHFVRQFSCGCQDISPYMSRTGTALVRCPAHVGIANMGHPEQP